MKEGEKLRNLLASKGIHEKEISEKFGISIRQVYRYYESDTISRTIKKKFNDYFGIIIDKEDDQVKDDNEKYLKKDSLNIEDLLGIVDLKNKIDAMQKEISRLTKVIDEKMK